MDKSELRNHNTIGCLDEIITNPPFGSKIPVEDKNVLEQYELAHIWLNDKKSGTWTKTQKLQFSVPPEILFIERCTQLLVTIGGEHGLASSYTGARFKRIWVEKSDFPYLAANCNRGY